jgi:protein HIRA/HIR1
MVVAEVPLWVVHASESTARIDPNTGGPASVSTTSRAQDSLSLFETAGGGAKKCAIYGVDMHPEGTKFATGGGDGTVRIWSTAALFAKHRGVFAEGGVYESSDSAPSDDDVMMGAPPTPKKDDDAAQEPPADVEVINDLNLLVRRKKDGQAAAPKVPVPKATAPSPSKAKRDPSANHRLLCTLSAHTGSSVLAVRFSTSGQYLASAGDDAVVCVYAPSSGMAGGNLSDNVEQWSRIKLCRGHTLDVVGLAWAPDDSHLVSCSLDSDAPIIVWKLTDLGSQERRTQANVLCNPYKILGKGVHTSTVKGVTFDPAGSYIASSGDDPAVCIWRAHDDWGLEKRVDASTGIFRKWKEGDVHELSGQTMFRRLSWSTDGAYICSTNASIKNKHVASTISRDGWSVSSAKSAASGAANLVGHKQPVVVSRHCPNLLDARKAKENGDGGDDDDDDDDDEPDYATLIALGDKRGFVTVWSTRKSRPLFKLQCSESRCTVTDLAWGAVGKTMILLVSMLDGHVVALRFNVPEEIGPLLSDHDQKRVFQLRYGIDFDNNNGLRRGGGFVGDNTTPKLIENALQFTLEDQESEEGGALDSEEEEEEDDDPPLSSLMSPSKVKASQTETKSKGKKRIRPVLMSVDDDIKRPKQNGDSSGAKKEKKKSDAVQDALELAAKAASAAEDVVVPTSKAVSRNEAAGDTPQHIPHAPSTPHKQQQTISASQSLSFAKLPHSTDRIHSVDLPSSVATESAENAETPKMVADCTNSNRVPPGSSGQPLPCIKVSISHAGQNKWRDDIVGTSCTALGVCNQILAVGTSDGCLYLYGTSPSLGWYSGTAFRSHPPVVFGHAIVAIQIRENKKDETEKGVDIVVVAADGMFGVYSILPTLKLKFKGTTLPAMTHMVLASTSSNDTPLPKLARIQMTENGHLLMILTLSPGRGQESRQRSGNGPHAISPGGSLQAFVYDPELELWMRVSDSRFILSDFYSTLPSSKSKSRGVLSKIDDAVRSGASASSIRPSRRGRTTSEGHASSMYNDQDSSSSVSRSHCEDRMACAVALGSAKEFQLWLSQYVKVLAGGGDEAHLRLLVEMLLSKETSSTSPSAWWLSSAPTVLDLSRKALVKTAIIPEMSKNRGLQRLTNEISLDVETSP